MITKVTSRRSTFGRPEASCCFPEVRRRVSIDEGVPERVEPGHRGGEEMPVPGGDADSVWSDAGVEDSGVAKGRGRSTGRSGSRAGARKGRAGQDWSAQALGKALARPTEAAGRVRGGQGRTRAKSAGLIQQTLKFARSQTRFASARRAAQGKAEQGGGAEV